MNRPLWTESDLTEALAAAVPSKLSVYGVSIDSRKIQPGDLFVALRGPNFNGEDFIADAATKGAVAALVQSVPQNAPPNIALIQVDDTQEALLRLAQFARRRFRGKVIGITGSVGKTGTKEALRHVLSQQGKAFANEGNLNNHIGVPLSLARLPQDADFAILEMGMNHPGEIAPLSVLAQPAVGIVTAIAPAHIEFFPNGIDGIADEKAEIVAGMGPQGAAIFNRDSPLFDRLSKRAEAGRVGRIIGFGGDAFAQARLLGCRLHADNSEIEANIMGETVNYRIGIPGRHIAVNSLAVLAAAGAVGANVAQAAASLETLRPFPGRGQRRKIAVAGGSIELIDESYNASSESMRAALDVLAAAKGRRIAVLGDMLELGARSAGLHEGLAEPILRTRPDQVFLCGQFMEGLSRLLIGKIPVQHAPDAAALAAIVAGFVKPGDVVMVKGSLGSKMRLIIEALDRLS